MFLLILFLALQYYAGSKKYTRDVYVFCDFHFEWYNVTRVVKSTPAMFLCLAILLWAIQCNACSKKYPRDVFVLCNFHFQRSNVTRVVKSIPVMFVCLGILTLNDPTALWIKKVSLWCLCVLRFSLWAIQCNKGSKKYIPDVCVLCHSHFHRSHVTWVVKSIPVTFVCFANFIFSDPKLRG